MYIWRKRQISHLFLLSSSGISDRMGVEKHHMSDRSHRPPRYNLDILEEELYGLVHVTGWESYDLRDLTHVLGLDVYSHYTFRPCTASHSVRYKIYSR